MEERFNGKDDAYETDYLCHSSGKHIHQDTQKLDVLFFNLGATGKPKGGEVCLSISVSSPASNQVMTLSIDNTQKFDFCVPNGQISTPGHRYVRRATFPLLKGTK